MSKKIVPRARLRRVSARLRTYSEAIEKDAAFLCAHGWRDEAVTMGGTGILINQISKIIDRRLDDLAQTHTLP
jgi:hypothetical protein